MIEAFNTKLGFRGIANIVTAGRAIGEPATIGVGRIHYGLRRWIGTTSGSAAEAYSLIPENGGFRARDRCLVIGAGGPMGQMHVLRAIYSGLPGLSIVATETNPSRRKMLIEKIAPIAEERCVPLQILDPGECDLDGDFTYVTLMVPSPDLMSNALGRCGNDAILNVFAGIPAFTVHPIDLDALIRKRCFLFGTSGSVLGDMKNVLNKVCAGELNTEISVDAIAGMLGAIDGLHAVDSRARAGKIIVYPELHDLDLVPLEDLPERFPSVAAQLSNGCWTKEAEQELLRVARRRSL
jgi:threonine dehydrogenase-like Zn-dependent dehydrogenase